VSALPENALPENGIDTSVEALMRPVADGLAAVVFFPVPVAGAEVPFVVLWLVVGALFFTLRFRFISVRGFRHALRLVRSPLYPSSHGEVSHFQALSTALSGTVGIGNIGGVAVAVSVGGPGAAFWLVAAGVLAMSTKFVECSLGVLYRRENADGSVSGGPMYYLERGLGERGWARLGRGLGVFYALGIVVGCLGIGNMFQSNQAFVQILGVTGGEASPLAGQGWLVGLVLAMAVGAVILGGIHSIARVTSRLVPIMAVLYLASAFVVIGLNAEALPWALGQMLGSAFTPDAAGGGALGAMVVGFQRALFSNEAGIGSATIAHSAVQTDEPMTEGFVSLLEPFLDTIVICQATALVIITTTYFEPEFATGLGGIEITSAAFGRVVSWSPLPLALAATLFAFSTMISWSYYGLKGVTYLVGESRAAENVFKLVFCTFVALGCMLKLEAILDFSDALVFLICVPNLFGLYVLTPVVRARMRAYAEAEPGERPGP
jgi:AGCS family alanine or glycine:cation symporter